MERACPAMPASPVGADFFREPEQSSRDEPDPTRPGSTWDKPAPTASPHRENDAIATLDAAHEHRHRHRSGRGRRGRACGGPGVGGCRARGAGAGGRRSPRGRHLGSPPQFRGHPRWHCTTATGSLKARCCVRGLQLMYDYCARRRVAHRRIGKLIVATDEHDREELQALAARAQANGVETSWLEGEQAMQLEPSLRCVAALDSPHSGIVDVPELITASSANCSSTAGRCCAGPRCNRSRPTATRFASRPRAAMPSIVAG